ncbi:MAG: 8-oxo-dGTP diphosphatase [Acidimicrobiaceae bacterium]|nr:8-oxo-dGTP diphosphatase [Acidimicrobiaceae bacterium]
MSIPHAKARRQTEAVREWLVASGIIEGPGSLLLVQNRRRDGRMDWSPPGGVIEVADGESVREGLTREVHEETGITVTEWAGPVWSVEAEAEAAGWRLNVEVFRAVAYEGEITVDDPDGIVVDARFVPVDDCQVQLASTWLPTHEPLVAWLAERWTDSRSFKYRVHGASRDDFQITRL